jgi:hypothetical protein
MPNSAGLATAKDRRGGNLSDDEGTTYVSTTLNSIDCLMLVQPWARSWLGVLMPSRLMQWEQKFGWVAEAPGGGAVVREPLKVKVQTWTCSR